MRQLKELLWRSVVETARTRQYQAWIDDGIDRLLPQFDLERGLMGTRDVELPDEGNADYVELPLEERRRLTSPEAAEALKTADSRHTSAKLAAMAWCRRNPLSRHYQDPTLLTCVRNGLEAFCRRQREDGTWVFGLQNTTGFSLGWTVEGLIFSYIWLYDELDEGFRQRLLEMFRRGAEWYKNDSGFHPVSNQHAIWCWIMALYGQLLDEPEYLQRAAAQWQVAQHVLARDGQVVEQGGPCANYSRTTFIYVYLYLLITQNHEHDAQLKEAMKWFRRMHTNSMYPFEGMSSRSYHDVTHGMMDTLPCLEHFAGEEPIFSRFIDDYVAQEKRDYEHVHSLGHAGSPLLWAMMEHQGERAPGPEEITRWRRPFDRMYWKWDIQYLLVHRAYQTAVTFRGRLGLKGLQTWAWGDEAPIVHHTLHVGSRTQAWGVDTAEFNVGSTMPKFGAGAKAEQVLYIPGDLSERELQYAPSGIDQGLTVAPCVRYFRWTQSHHHPGGMEEMVSPGDPAQVVTRWGRLWCFYIFTPVATVVLQNGAVGPRRTQWALNPVCVPPADIEQGLVRFEGREGCIHFLNGKPRREEIEQIPVLTFEFDAEELGAFGFSDGSFRFTDYDAAEHVLRFEDSAGSYVASFASIMNDKGYVTWDYGARCNRAPQAAP